MNVEEVLVRSGKGIDCPKWVSNRERDGQKRITRAEAEARDYLGERRVPELYNFLIGHLVASKPDDPVAFLYDLLDKCTLFRAGLVDPPLLFTPRHIESMFKSLDPGGRGHITLDQYKTGMRTLGIEGFKPNPMACQCDPDRVDKETFEQEAKRCLVKSLKKMITKPRVCIEEPYLNHR